MAADIFTKPFPDAKSAVWKSNLALINVFDSHLEADMNYHPSVVQSMRGDLDKPKAVPLEQADLGYDNENANMAAVAAKYADDDSSTTCPEQDDRNIVDFSDDHQFNDEWNTDTDDWVADLQLPRQMLVS